MSEITRSVQHRCSRMADHSGGGCKCHPRLPIPCPECYSVVVTAERVDWRPAEPWASLPPDDVDSGHVGLAANAGGVDDDPLNSQRQPGLKAADIP